MKCKPMLLKKVLQTKSIYSRVVIGIIGVHRGVGVTQTGIMLAYYLGEELGIKTALLECNNHQDYSILEEIYDWPYVNRSSFGFGQITLCKGVTKERLTSLLGNDYECFVIDFGSDFQGNLEEFQRCGRKLIIGGRSDWERYKLSSFIQRTASIQGSESWDYLIPSAPEKHIIKLSKETKRRVWSVPANEEPMILSRKTCNFFNELLRS